MQGDDAGSEVVVAAALETGFLHHAFERLLIRMHAYRLREVLVAIGIPGNELAQHGQHLERIQVVRRLDRLAGFGEFQDQHFAEEFQRLLNFAKPDLEEELSAVVGDVAAHRIGEVARGLGKWGRDASAVMGANLREYLQEESRDVPSRYEVDRFSKRVGSLRDDIDRLEARIKRLRANR